jgi:transglycosylase-like protein with SLT domain
MSVDTSKATAAAAVDPTRARVAGAIKQASNSTGTSFQYLLATAKMESDFNPTAGATTSSARGLYQFIDQTWLATVKDAGTQLGYGQYADAITKTRSGDYTVDDPSMRRAIMNLRDDPAASSAMAAALTQNNSFQLTGQIGRRPTDSELYMAHFMGVGGAARLISSAGDSPQATAARIFPNAASANHAIFYDHAGRARSVSEVYAELNSRYAGAANSQAAQSAIAMYGSSVPNAAVASATAASAPAVDSAAYLSTFPDVRASAPTTLASASDAGNQTGSADPMFRSLFQVDERSQPVSPRLGELWGKSSSLTSVANADGQPSSTGAPRPLDLFSDRNGTFSG